MRFGFRYGFGVVIGAACGIVVIGASIVGGMKVRSIMKDIKKCRDKDTDPFEDDYEEAEDEKDDEEL